MHHGQSQHSENLYPKIVAVSAGEAHTLALTGDGRIYSWGRGTFGRLGTGRCSDELFPVPVEFNLSKKILLSAGQSTSKMPKFVGIAAGAYHSLALEDDGTVWSWGYNTYGQLGLNGEDSPVPRVLERFLELGRPDALAEESSSESKVRLEVSCIKAGGMMSLAIDSLGSLWIWGNCPDQGENNAGGFSLVSSSTPLPVWDFHGHTVVKVACGNEHVVALVSADETFAGGGDLVCYTWGNNNHGQLGLGDNQHRLRPEVVKTFDKDCPWSVYEVACGAFHTAVLAIANRGNEDAPSALQSNDIGCVCWTFGLGEDGQLGNGTNSSTNLPEPVTRLPGDAFLISLNCGLFHTCVVSAAGDVWAWGMEKGLGLCPDASRVDAGDALYPSRIHCNEMHGGKFPVPVQVACGAAHTVLVADDGYKIWCWGRGRSGVLGRGNTNDSFVPCIAMWPPLHDDFKKEDTEVAAARQVTTSESRRVLEMEKKLSLATEAAQKLQSKLALVEWYASLLHSFVFGKPMQEQDLTPIRARGAFSIQKEWKDLIESADREKLAQMEALYRNMHESVKDKLMKKKVEEMIKECMRSLTLGSGETIQNYLPPNNV